MQNLENISSEPFLSGYTFRTLASQGILSDDDSEEVRSLGNGFDVSAMVDGDILFVPIDYLRVFFENVHPHIRCKYKLISSKSDLVLTQDYEQFVDDKIIHWWSINKQIKHDKVSAIPLGLDNKNWRFKNNPQGETSHIEEVAFEDIFPDKDILLSFKIQTNVKERKICSDIFKDHNGVTCKSFSDRDRFEPELLKEYYREIKRHRFVLCPFGNGFDCHRNWQILYLNYLLTFPIIKKHDTMDEFYDLPVWWVDDWDEVLNTNLDEKYTELQSKEYNSQKLFFNYWKKVILENF